MLIGKRIKELREQKKMSLKELAEKSGVQIATLSRIENLKMTGTVNSHLNIAKALNIELIDLYTASEHIEAPSLTVQVNTPQTTAELFTYNTFASYEILATQLFKKKMMPIILRIDPGGKTNAEQNPAGAERFVFVLEGEVRVYIGKDVYPLKTNNSLYFDASVEHYFENMEKKTAKIISVMTPVAL